MIRKRYVNLNKKDIMKNTIYVIIIFILYSCSGDRKQEKLVFNNLSFEKTLREFVEDIEKYPVRKEKSILVCLFTKNNTDTIVRFLNYYPTKKKNLVTMKQFENYEVYFYSSQELKFKLKDLIEFQSNEDYKVDIEESDDVCNVYMSDYKIIDGELFLY